MYKKIIFLIPFLTFKVLALCLESPMEFANCRYPEGDSWCYLNQKAKPYAYKDSCLESLQQFSKNNENEYAHPPPNGEYLTETPIKKQKINPDGKAVYNYGYPQKDFWETYANPTNSSTDLPGKYVIKGKVINVADGDTVTILSGDYQKNKIRLYGIDAPESGQDFGKKSKQLLSQLVKGKAVTAHCYEKDKYHRDVCTLFAPGGEDVNLIMVGLGGAWVYRKYYKETEYYRHEKEAKQNKQGLWAIPHAQPPWEWRKGDTVTPNAPPVKLSRNNICHSIGSRYYNRVKHYTRFENIADCLRYGRLPKQ